jgi:hypothetical protein
MSHDAGDLPADGFNPVGKIRREPGQRCQAVECRLAGPVLYALVVETRVMKIGISGTQKQQLRARMQQTAGEIEKNIRVGTTRTEAFKNLATIPIKADKEIEVWAKQWPDLSTIRKVEEVRLTLKYDPPWTGSVKRG